ncbi:MAG: ArnT family glycosyltransferase [Chthoniobacterales bacterium]
MSTSVVRNLALVVVTWAAIYLPWLGTPELRSEEGHRVLPAVEMLESGDYIVPHVGGQPYLAKPPFVNWKIAAAFRLTGIRNEWTARLVSAVHVLAAAVVIATVGRGLLGSGAWVAAIAWLTNLGMIEKGRMIEIDAIYVSLFAIAFVCWLVLWDRRGSRWLTWTVPWLFLGFGLLAKGPAHLIFFYALVIAILWRTKKLRDLVHPAHAIGLVLMVTIFAAWAVPCFRAISGASISQTWKYELVLRLTGGENAATDWPMNFPRGFGYLLPWLLVLPFIRIANVAPERRHIATGLALGAAVPFVVVLLLPGTIPRYILPTLVPVCLLIGLAVRDNAFNWRIGSITAPARAVWALVAFFVAVSGIIFAARSATTLKNAPKVRPIAERVNAVVPSTEPLFAVTPLFQPYLFYVHSPVRYVNSVDQLPPQARFFITGPTERPKVDSSKAELLFDTPEYRGHSTALFRMK